MEHNSHHEEHVTTALLLAAGTGSRLYPLTQNAPKCLTIVNGMSILERLISNLNRHGFKRLVVVTGYMERHIRDFLGHRIGNVEIEYIFSPLYKTTNNIYSLWMARKVIDEPFLLLESDLVFDESLLDAMRYPDKIAVAKLQPWMNGTCITIKSQRVRRFLAYNADSFGEVKYKTVNIYSISHTSWRCIIKKLDKHILAGEVNGYYETVFAEMIANGDLSFKIVFFNGKPWYEIDTIKDLAEAEKLFPLNNYVTAENDTLLHLDIFDMQSSVNVAISPEKRQES
ncbi:sugar phosphate nucleotidyltransferase [Candidatus Acidulodesulfobacterium sp. H_13]|uniref:phosphocholine cytidylyltransferase family protein n=1 Tax=Candidatus Acidulodesulfobacterium sp. H_13 TaxID=3395470 RepID=UPI003AF7F16F